MAALSRAEKILLSKIDGNGYDDPAQSRLEELLLGLNTSGGTDTTELTREVLSLKKDVSNAKTTVTQLQENVDSMKTSVTNLELHAILDSEA